MCIIVAKKQGVAIPSEETFDNCVATNRDGIGIAYNLPGERPHIAKGFTNIKKLMKVLEVCEITEEHNLIVHFRYATHGKKDPGNCHPFPLTSIFEDMRLLNCSCGCAVAHNGVFGSMPKSEQHSDTMKFVSGILASPEIIDNLGSAPIKELIRGYCGLSSKLAFLTPKGLNLIGEWEEEKGVYYSNKQYQSWKSTYNWKNEEQEYCGEHLKYDKCWKSHKKAGREWCYSCKKWDYCTWCSDHKERDTCEYEAKRVRKEGDNPPIVLPKCDRPDLPPELPDPYGNSTLVDLRFSCEWCESKEQVRYESIYKANLCSECSTTLSTY